jgi:hypothetical protein
MDAPHPQRKLVLLLALTMLGCEDDFEPISHIESVRILATQADKPYAKPDDEIVKVRVLAHDGRSKAARDANPVDMKVYSLSTPCENPFSDLYYACYLDFAARFQPGPVLPSSEIKEGPEFEVRISSDIISRRPPTPGSDPFGSVFAFSMACPGTLHYLGLQAGPSPQSPPFACFDSQGKRLGYDSFVFAFTRIFAFETRTNKNPLIQSLTVAGQTFSDKGALCSDTTEPCEPSAEVSLAGCTKKDVDDCSKVKVDITVPPSEQETDPSSARGREQVWVDYYATGGKFEDDIRVLYDATEGKLSDTAVDFRRPKKRQGVTDQTEKLWAVVHDSRGGVSWVSMRLKIDAALVDGGSPDVADGGAPEADAPLVDGGTPDVAVTD